MALGNLLKNQTNRWMKMLLEDKNAVIYGGGGAIGGGPVWCD
jgi:hypothetical protein